MIEGTPSRTALRVAMRRAAHQVFDRPLVLEDPVALRILPQEQQDEVKRTPDGLRKPFSAAIRAFMVVRSRYAEDLLGAAVARGLSQYVLLGAGLDTFAYRNPFPSLRVFEVDFPATQVCNTFASRIFSGGNENKSSDTSTMSASLPGLMVPFSWS